MLPRRNANLLAGRKRGLLPVPERVNDFIVELESGKPSCQLENALIVARTVGIEIGDLKTVQAVPAAPDDDLGFLPMFGADR